MTKDFTTKPEYGLLQFLRCCTISFSIKFKRMVALTDEAYTIKFNVVKCLNLIGESNVLHLSITQCYIQKSSSMFTNILLCLSLSLS
jgi:hypothetical protein